MPSRMNFKFGCLHPSYSLDSGLMLHQLIPGLQYYLTPMQLLDTVGKISWWRPSENSGGGQGLVGMQQSA